MNTSSKVVKSQKFKKVQLRTVYYVLKTRVDIQGLDMTRFATKSQPYVSLLLITIVTSPAWNACLHCCEQPEEPRRDLGVITDDGALIDGRTLLRLLGSFIWTLNNGFDSRTDGPVLDP